MKQFIYLDMDIVNSIVAQKENGLLTSIQLEERKDNEDIESNKHIGKNEGKIKSNFLDFISAYYRFNDSDESAKENKQSQAYQQIIEKTLHDKIFDYAHEFIKEKKIDEKECDYGEYIEISKVFTFVDINYLEKFLNQSTIKKFIMDDTSDVLKCINLLHDIIPYERMLISYDGFLIPLDDKYLRVNPKNIGFMYGGELKCVGMITNIIGEDTSPIDDSDVFSTLQFSINEVLRSILPTKEKNLCVVHPIAIYYEK